MRRRFYCVFILTALLSGITPAVGQHPQWLSARCDPLSSPAPRIQRLHDWLDALERHEAGRIDEPAARVHGWPADVLAQVQIDLRSLVILIRRPDTTTFYRDPNPGQTDPLRRSPIAYSGAERTALRALACTLAGRTTPDRLLMRGALLHTDVAVAASRLPRSGHPDRPTGGFSSVPPHLTVSMYEFEDGEMVGEFQVLSHWALARTLLDGVTREDEGDDRPDPGRNAAVRLWYRASLAVMHRTERLERQHFRRALELFPSDPEILTLAGAFHETLAERAGGALRIAMVARALDASSEANELRRAEDLYRRALEADPGHAAARVRRGRVLGLLGRPAEAYDELSRALSGSREMEPRLRYYSYLFLAREAVALGRRNEARAAYERAAALFPRAQTPHVGLSELAYRDGDSAGALTLLRSVLGNPADALEREDPWWSYGSSAGRDAEALLQAVYRRFPASLDRD